MTTKNKFSKKAFKKYYNMVKKGDMALIKLAEIMTKELNGKVSSQNINYYAIKFGLKKKGESKRSAIEWTD